MRLDFFQVLKWSDICAGFNTNYHTKQINIFYQMMQERKKNVPENHYNEASLNNYNDILDFNSRPHMLYHEQSMNISQIGYSIGPGNQNSRNFSNIQNHQNTINLQFWDKRSYLHQDQVIKREDGFIGYEEESISTPPRRFNVMTKGLKSLAWNIHKILQKRSFSSADELSQTIQLSLKSRIKKLKNVKEEEEINSFEKKKKCDQGKKSTRRRIYDALNVMIAVGLVGKRRQKIEISRVFTPISNKISYKDTNQTLIDLRKQMLEKEESMKWKRQIIQNKERQILKLNFLLKRNEESKESQGSVEKKIYFPFVVVAFKEENQIEAMKCDNKLITLEYKLSEKVRVQGDTNTLFYFIDESQVEVKKFLSMQDI